MNISTFEAFNARDLEPAKVATSFVPFEKYDELLKPHHSLLIGPRGSGKTTLLKMLSLEALRAWEHPRAEEYRKRVDYSGIFVPADITWGGMVDSLADESVPQDCANALGEIAFGINVMLATTEVMGMRLREGDLSSLYRGASVTGDIEALVRAIAKNWELELETISFNGIAEALRFRLASLYSRAKGFSHHEQPTMSLLYKMIPYAKLDVFACIEFALSTYDHHVNDKNGRWAVLFDEFEVVPVHIQQKLIAKLRASATKIIYKVALAPCGPQTKLLLGDINQPSPLDDVSRTELWYREKKDAISFCRKLFESRAKKYPEPLSGLRPEKLFGRSLAVDEVDTKARRSRELSGDEQSAWEKHWKNEFSSLAEKDDSFRRFLESKSISTDSLDPSPRAMHGNLVRKIAPIVAFRNAYRSASGKGRGRKAYYQQYVGWEAIATISEGNPRWFIGMLSGLEAAARGSGKTPVAKNLQWDQVCRAVSAFTEKLKAVAIEENIGITTKFPVFSLLDQIGDALHKGIVIDDFVENATMSFTVDGKISDDVESSLRIALNFGGIVCYDPPDNVAGYISLKGKRFRIAYILCPEFKLPLRGGEARALSTLLASNKPKEKVKALEDGAQGSLW